MSIHFSGLTQEMWIYLVILIVFGLCCCCAICCIFYYHYQVRTEMMDLLTSFDKKPKKNISLKQQIQDLKKLQTISPPSQIRSTQSKHNSSFEGTNTDIKTSPLKIMQLNKLRQLSSQNNIPVNNININNNNNSHNNSLNTPKYKPIKNMDKNSPYSCSSSTNLIRVFQQTPSKPNKLNQSGTDSTLVNGVSSQYLKLKQSNSPNIHNKKQTNMMNYRHRYFQTPIMSHKINTFSPSKSYDNTNLKFVPMNNNINNQITPPIIIAHNISNNMNHQQYMHVYPPPQPIFYNNNHHNSIPIQYQCHQRPQIIASNSKSTQAIKRQLSQQSNESDDDQSNASTTPTIPDNNTMPLSMKQIQNTKESETEQFPSRKLPSQPVIINSPSNDLFDLKFNNHNELPAIPPTETATDFRSGVSESDSVMNSSTSEASEVTKTLKQTPTNVIININEEESDEKLDDITWMVRDKIDVKLKNKKYGHNKARLSISKTPQKMPTIDETIDFNEKEISFNEIQLQAKLSPFKNIKRESKSNTNTVIIHEDTDDDFEYLNKSKRKNNYLTYDDSPQSIISPLSIHPNLEKSR